jgi:tryptophanyl-tRNA synthetase
VKVKKFLYEVLMEELSPIQAKRHELEKDVPAVMEILKQGSIQAREIAAKTLDEVKSAMKINYWK